VVIGATCTLRGNGDTRTETTDGFGDFWFEGLEVGRYSLEIAAGGFPNRSFASISTEADVNLGDIALA
jgi:tetrathionate reductase subunit B